MGRVSRPKNVVSKPGNASEIYAIMSNIAVIQTTFGFVGPMRIAGHHPDFHCAS